MTVCKKHIKITILCFCGFLMVFSLRAMPKSTTEGRTAFIDGFANVAGESKDTALVQTLRMPDEEKPVVVHTVEVVRVDTVYVDRLVYLPSSVDAVRQKNPFYISVKSNLLYDAVLLPNLSVEIPFGRKRNWSVAIDGNWSWWNTGADDYNYHRIQMAGIELRRWFANRTGNPLNGWYAGIYGYGGDYDIRLFADDNSDIGQQSPWSYSGGLTLGYALPVGRRFNLEFGLGAGFLGGTYKKYTVSDCEDGVFPLLSTHRRSYFGLTKASVSLVWLIGSGTNQTKGKEARR